RLEIPVLHPAARRVDADVGPVEVAPHRSDLRSAVAADGGEVAERLLVEDVAVLVETRGHGHFLPALNCSSTENAWRIDLTARVPRYGPQTPTEPSQARLGRRTACGFALPRAPGNPRRSSILLCLRQLVPARVGHRPQREEQPHDALLDEQRILRERVRQPLARPLVVLGREAKGGGE